MALEREAVAKKWALCQVLVQAELQIQFYEFRREVQCEFCDIRTMGKKEPVTVFGLRLRQARLRAGIPQYALGVAIGLDDAIASARISRYESGVHEPPFEVAQKLARVLKVSAAYLYCEDDDLAKFVLTWPYLNRTDKKKIGHVVESRLVSKGLLEKSS
ncbi:hypothetical protein GCM10009079_32370 [Ralstonia mannitolilytica]|uniref:Helix-turn-helix n=2 Tax=Ralstonia mannitolilytica TaxID=105219 RepID=A0AAJ5D3L6_9RALS|nr:Helix-turn-helix [Ralstonia mannitolilytica]